MKERESQRNCCNFETVRFLACFLKDPKVETCYDKCYFAKLILCTAALGEPPLSTSSFECPIASGRTNRRIIVQLSTTHGSTVQYSIVLIRTVYYIIQWISWLQDVTRIVAVCHSDAIGCRA